MALVAFDGASGFPGFGLFGGTDPDGTPGFFIEAEVLDHDIATGIDEAFVVVADGTHPIPDKLGHHAFHAPPAVTFHDLVQADPAVDQVGEERAGDGGHGSEGFIPGGQVPVVGLVKHIGQFHTGVQVDPEETIGDPFGEGVCDILPEQACQIFAEFDLSKEERTVARRQMAGILGLSTTASGLMGLPGIALLTWFAEAVGGDEDDPYDAEVEFRKYLAGLFGKDVAHALSKGVANGFLGIDLHSRVKLSDMFYQSDNRDLSPRDEALGTMATVSGPFFSYLINSWVGLNEVMEGDGWRGMERMMPKFIRDGMRTIRYNDEGLVDASGNVMVEDFSLYEKAWRTIGIGSAKESEAWEARSAVKGYQSHIGRRRSTLLNDYDKARRENDQDALQRVMEQIGGFNAARRINDQPKLMISGKTLSQSTRTRERRRKQTEKGIYLPSSQLGMRDLTTGYVY